MFYTKYEKFFFIQFIIRALIIDGLINCCYEILNTQFAYIQKT